MQVIKKETLLTILNDSLCFIDGFDTSSVDGSMCVYPKIEHLVADGPQAATGPLTGAHSLLKMSTADSLSLGCPMHYCLSASSSPHFSSVSFALAEFCCVQGAPAV